MAGAVAGQRLGQPAQHQVAVRFEHHVDEVDDDDAADIAQPQLAHDLLCGLEVVPGNGLFQVAARAGELAGVHVDHGHRFGAVDDQRAAGRQPHLAVHRLSQLLVDAVHGENVRTVRPSRLVLRQPGNQLWRNGIHVLVDGVPRLVARHDEPGEVLVEQVADDLDQHVGLFVERYRCTGGLLLGLVGLGLDLGPPLLQPVHVDPDVVFLDTLRGGADDHAGFGRNHLAQNLFESLAFGVGQLAADAGGRRSRHIDQIAAGQ
jgi:hypothetical protein